MNKQSFYDYLRVQCPNLDAARKFYKDWMLNGQQSHYGEFTMRAMAAHISRAMEGKEEQAGPTDVGSTKYGLDIYLGY